MMENTDSFLHIYFIYNGRVSEKRKRALIRLVKKRQHEITFLLIDDTAIGEVPLHGYISINTYYRLFLEELLPKELSKVIYIDADVIVKKDIKELFALPMADNVPLLAARDCLTKQGLLHYGLAQDKEKFYFNAGILVLNLDYWRKNTVKQQAILYIEQNKDKLLQRDQDVLNHLFRGKAKEFDIRWNYQVLHILKTEEDFQNNALDEFQKESILKQEAWAIHYTGEFKPWMWRYKFSYAEKFWRPYYYYKKKTVYRFSKPTECPSYLYRFLFDSKQFAKKVYLYLFKKALKT